MSMSQEDIEALMNSAGDISDETSADDSQIEDLDLSTEETDDNLEDILSDIDGITDDNEADVSSEDNFDDILAGIDGISDDDISDSNNDEASLNKESAATVEEMIDQKKYPLPVEKEHKVVNQLTEVAEDSEQKASQIFDVLSYILDENNEIQSFNTEIENYFEKQKELLSSLSNKFPNVEIFKENLEETDKMIELSGGLSGRLDNENNKIFEAMELMQYHDINRQKIERVMSVIRKLNDYLNGIFEDDSDRPEVQIAKHISGDSHETVDADDIESLISEYS
jgi:predicted  nucleic acid-binding Zn-ribbon protein